MGTPLSHHHRLDTLARPAVDPLRQLCPTTAVENRRPPLRSPAQEPARQGVSMSQVNTVRGPVGGADLGRTLMHEHIFVLSPEIEKPSAEWDESAEQARAVGKLRELKAAGIDTLVDLTVVGLGRYIPRIAIDRGAGTRDQRGGGDRCLHLQRGPDVLPLPRPWVHPRWTRTDGRTLRARDRGRNRRDRSACRDPQVRVRPPGHHAGG